MRSRPLRSPSRAQQLTTASAPQQITLTNSGDVALTLISAQITSGDFTVVNACGNSLNPHSTCAINVTFQPQSIGRVHRQLTVSDQYRTQTVALERHRHRASGRLALAALHAHLSHHRRRPDRAAADRHSHQQRRRFRCNCKAPLVTGDFSIVPGSNTCGTTLAPANACTLQIVFTPTIGGTRTGTLTITDSAPNSPQVLHLTGTAVDFALSPDGNTTVTIASGQNAVFPLLFTSGIRAPGTATFTCTGAPLNATCNVTPSSIPLGATATVSVIVLTGTPTASLALPGHPAKAERYGSPHFCRSASSRCAAPVFRVSLAASAALLSSLPHGLRSRTPASVLRLIRHAARPNSGHSRRNLSHRCLGHQRRAHPHDQPHPHRAINNAFHAIMQKLLYYSKRR